MTVSESRKDFDHVVDGFFLGYPSGAVLVKRGNIWLVMGQTIGLSRRSDFSRLGPARWRQLKAFLLARGASQCLELSERGDFFCPFSLSPPLSAHDCSPVLLLRAASKHLLPGLITAKRKLIDCWNPVRF